MKSPLSVSTWQFVAAVPVVRPELSRNVCCCASAGSAASITVAVIAVAASHVTCVLTLMAQLRLAGSDGTVTTIAGLR